MESGEGTRTVRYVVIGVLAAAALLVGLTNGRILGLQVSTTPRPAASVSGSVIPTATAAAKPPLLQAADYEFATPILLGQETRASTAMEDYWSNELTSGSTDNEIHFVDWAIDQVAAQPTNTQRTTERAQLKAITQSARAQLAAEWLSLNGCRAAWVAFVNDATPIPGADTTGPVRSELNDVLTLAAKVAAGAQAKFDKKSVQSTPCQGNTNPVRKDCKCLYPSSAATMSAAARTYLDARDSARNDVYGIMEKQVDTGMMYSGLELQSDIKSGAYLGYLVGMYYLTSHGYEDSVGNASATPTPRA